MTALLSVILGVVLELFLNKILLLINTDVSTFEYARDYLDVYLVAMIPSYIFCHITAMLRCYGDSVFQMLSMIITVLNQIAVRIPFSILLSKTALGLDGIWITLLISFIIAFLCAYIIDRNIKNKCDI